MEPGVGECGAVLALSDGEDDRKDGEPSRVLESERGINEKFGLLIIHTYSVAMFIQMQKRWLFICDILLNLSCGTTTDQGEVVTKKTKLITYWLVNNIIVMVLHSGIIPYKAYSNVH